jgi:hypothetical protein
MDDDDDASRLITSGGGVATGGPRPRGMGHIMQAVRRVIARPRGILC